MKWYKPALFFTIILLPLLSFSQSSNNLNNCDTADFNVNTLNKSSDTSKFYIESDALGDTIGCYIFGEVVDSHTLIPISGTTITVVPQNNYQFKDSAILDENGKFSINLPELIYHKDNLQIFCPQYKCLLINNFGCTDSSEFFGIIFKLKK